MAAQGRDTIAQAQSGTGKTTIFCAGVLQSLDTSQRETQALALSPTRELAEQTQKVMLALGDYMSVQCHACIGGKSIGEDLRRLDAGVHVVSGTPGRVHDMIRRRNLRTRGIKMLVLDEADEMLSKGFKEQIYEIYRYLPPATQVQPSSCLLALLHPTPWQHCRAGSLDFRDSTRGNLGDDAQVHDGPGAHSG